jgi:Ran GTPase-activating protein (RanGAP) involved in mRNA processing and transport
MEINDEDAKTIAFILETNPMKTLILSNTLTSLIAESLAFNRTLTILDLEDNLIADKRATCIAIMRVMNSTTSTLYQLNLNRNGIGWICARYLAIALEEETLALRELCLERNNIDPYGARLIASSLEGNTTLYRIYLSGNDLDHAAKAALLKSLHKNMSILDISADFSESESRVASRCLRVNESELVPKAIHGEISHKLFPQTVVYLSDSKQHVNKLFTILRERPDLLLG